MFTGGMFMLVKEFMKTEVVIISPETTITDTLYTMRKNKVKRLPVVEKGRIVGIVTDGDLREVSPSPATSLSVWELNYLLGKIPIRDFALKNVITVSPSEPLEEAAVLMRRNHVGGLPVVDGEKLVGMITESDIFDSFLDVMGFRYPGQRIVIEVRDKAGVIGEVAGILKEEGANITSFALYHKGPGAGHLVIRLEAKQFSQVLQRLEKQGYTIIG
jgi:acetoin utilization protein AcuB